MGITFSLDNGILRISNFDMNCVEDCILTLPSHVNGEKVLELDDFTFDEIQNFTNFKLKKIILPETLKAIGKATFAHVSVDEIMIPDSVERIDKYAFASCSQLKKVTWTSNVDSIPEGCFCDCVELVELNNIEHIVTIGDYAFIRRYATADFPNFTSLKKIGKSAFMNNRFTSLPVMESVDIVAADAFNSVTFTKEVTWFPNCPIIPDRCFFNARLKSISIPDSVGQVQSEAFALCKDLHDVRWSSNCPVVEQSTFAKCYDLEMVTNLEKVVEIEEGVFQNTNVKQLQFQNLKIIRKNAFYKASLADGVEGLENVELIETKAFFGTEIKKFRWPEHCSKIPKGCFAYCASLTCVENLSSIQEVGPLSFAFTKITNIDFRDSALEYMPANAFEGCFMLEGVKININTIVETIDD